MLLVIGVLIVAWPASSISQEWTRFRGPNGSGIGHADHLPTTWSDDDYDWTIPLAGIGHSSPVVWGPRIFVTSGDEQHGDYIVEAIDKRRGIRLWQRRLPIEIQRKHDLNSFASATPAVTADRLFVCWGNASELVVLAFNHDGRELWRQQVGSFHSGHGFGVSPVVYGDLVILPVDHQKQSTVFALDQSDGRIRWSVDRDSKLHYATPCLLRQADSDSLILSTWSAGVAALDPLTGRQRWSCDVFDPSHYESSIASPVVAGEMIIATCGYLGRGNELIAVRPPATHENARRIWRMNRAAPLCCTPLAHRELLFVWSDNGIVTCSDLETGQKHWQQRVGGNYYSSPVLAAGKLYNTSVKGEVVVLAASEDYQLLARNQLPEGSHSTCAIAEGVMYLRTFSKLLALGSQRTE